MKQQQTRYGLIVFSLSILFPAFSFAVPPVQSPKTSTNGKNETICLQETFKNESAHAIPRSLLKAISLAETGRWYPEQKTSFPWPWTVTSGNKSYFFDTKQEALRKISQLKSQGISNIDVGCMQINLHYHQKSFSSLEEALDPATNVAYGAAFLKRLYQKSGSWKKAIGRYHSSTKEYAERYYKKVAKLWKQKKKERSFTIAKSPPVLKTKNNSQPYGRYKPKVIDYEKMNKLNKQFRQRQKASNKTILQMRRKTSPFIRRQFTK